MSQSKRLAVAGFCLLSTAAIAETPPSALIQPESGVIVASAQPIDGSLTSKSTAQISSSSEWGRDLKDRLALNYWGAYYGPSVGGPNDYTPSYDGSSGDVQYLDGVITAGYRPSKKTLVGVGVPQIYTPFRENKGITTSNLFIRLSDSEIISRGRFKVGMGSRFYLPTNSDARDAGFVTGIRFEQNTTYDFRKIPLTLGLFTYERPYFYSSKATSGNPLTLYGAPYATYQLSQRLAATLWIDLIQLKQSKGQSMADMPNAPVDVQPGINWDVNDNLSVNPYLNLYPGNLTANASSVGMIVSAKVL
ncbi:MAG: hypothetical protein JST04_08850 [Bdellovibrionales bacterium]|nr:hypothetical protein [Bdellovibrionales bacterium]